ncbi:MAG: hypothetical protein ACJAT5_000084 [Lentimonas sp.]|jgi:hypothetical protein
MDMIRRKIPRRTNRVTNVIVPIIILLLREPPKAKTAMRGTASRPTSII